ncbi:MAG: hypothetical protein JXR05_08165 [Flavobacteriaceae bacterium]
MKKLKFLAIAMAFTLFTSMTVESNTSITVESEVVDNSDCVRMARSVVLLLAEGAGDDPNGANFEGWLALYNRLYLACYNS